LRSPSDSSGPEEDDTLRPSASDRQPARPDDESRGPDDEPPRTAWLPEGFEATGPPLGVGSTAVVWPASRPREGREFALKVWRRPFADDAERERFWREVRKQLALNRVSRHVVTYSWADEAPREGLPWIGMERHGESLQQLVERRRPALAEALATLGR
jgi:hypothetical protein